MHASSEGRNALRESPFGSAGGPDQNIVFKTTNMKYAFPMTSSAHHERVSGLGGRPLELVYDVVLRLSIVHLHRANYKQNNWHNYSK